MHKKFFKLILVLVLMSLVLGSSVMPVLGHNSGRGGYDYDQLRDTSINNENWMASLPDSMRISEMSIPGTHETMARCNDASSCGTEAMKWWPKCQSFSLADQLKIGIRALDIRCRHYGDKFAIHHERYHVDDMWFDKHVLEPVINFLTEHPTETVLMSIKPEYDPAPDCPQLPGILCNEKTFAQVLVDYINDTGAPVWQPPEGIAQPNPTLGEVRGKIVILDRFSGVEHESDYGIDWDYLWEREQIQDYFDLKKGANDMIDKWDAILTHLNDADNGSMDDIYINFLSGVGDGADVVGGVTIHPYPWFIASGHISQIWAEPGTGGGHQTWYGQEAPDQCGPFFNPSGVDPSDRCVLTGMPDLVLEWINTVSKPRRIGIIMADFPSDLLADAIINLNPQKIYIDIKPRSCPNRLNVKSRGVLPVAILGTSDFDVTQIDPESIRLLDVAPLRYSLKDVATPFEPSGEITSCLDCTEMGPDGYMDVTLKFRIQEIVAALGEINDGECIFLKLTGNLKEEFGGNGVLGEDVVDILKKGKGKPPWPSNAP